MASLTTTSYAILGLLNLRPYTAYELAAQSQRSLKYVWPTAPSRLYAEPKRLAEHGLIEIHEESAGPSRMRQSYRITPAGRQALRDWLRTPPSPPRVEAEILLRALFADAGDTEDLVASLEATRADVLEAYSAGYEVIEAYERGDVPFPERMHLNLIWMAFVRENLQLMHDWTVFAEEEISRWHRAGDRGRTRRAQELLDAIAGDDPVIPRRPMGEADSQPT
jgi:DNA-binding PadR family transcriptional regulator